MRMIYAMMLAALMALTGFSAPAWAQTAQPEIEILSLQAHPSDVDIGKPNTWVRPNVDPYSGDVAGAAFLGRVTDIRPLELQESWAMRARGECHRYQFGSGDVFRTTFGRDRSMLARPGFSGWADVCIVRGDGTAIVYPDDCKNIGPALAVIRRQEAAINIVIDQPQRTKVVISSTILGEPPTVASPGVLLTAPGGVYSGGNTNISVGSRSRSRATATNGGCTAACPPSPPSGH